MYIMVSRMLILYITLNSLDTQQYLMKKLGYYFHGSTKSEKYYGPSHVNDINKN